MAALYDHTPVTLGLSVVTLIFSYWYGQSDILSLDGDKVMQGQVWRLITGQLTFPNMSATIVGLLLLYFFRFFERQMGSKKYGAFLFLCWLGVSVLYTIGMAIAFSLDSSFNFAEGPLFFIFAQLAFFYRYIPKIYMNQYVLAGVAFSEKSGIYFLAAQVMFSEGLSSVAAACCGLLIGLLYDRNLLSMQRFRLPQFVERFFGTVATAISSVIPRPQFAAPNRNARQLAAGRGGATNSNNTDANWMQQRETQRLLQQMRQGGGAHGDDFDMYGDLGQREQLLQQLPPPSEADITTLMGLGFERSAVLQALQSAGNNVDAAANILLR